MEGAAGQSRRPVSLTVVSSLLSTLTGSLGHVTHLKPPHPHPHPHLLPPPRLSPLRQRQLEELQVLALQFHEALEPLGEWLSSTERRLSSAEPMGTQTAKITQQILKHKVLLVRTLKEHTFTKTSHPLRLGFI